MPVCGNGRNGIVAFIKFLQTDEKPILRNNFNRIHPYDQNKLDPLVSPNVFCVCWTLVLPWRNSPIQA